MSRSPELEAIFEARYAWENSAKRERDVRRKEYHRLLDAALARAGLTPNPGTRYDMEDTLFERYRDFRRVKQQAERTRLSRIR